MQMEPIKLSQSIKQITLRDERKKGPFESEFTPRNVYQLCMY